MNTMTAMNPNVTQTLKAAADDYLLKAGAIDCLVRACAAAEIDERDFVRQAAELRERARDVRRYLNGAR